MTSRIELKLPSQMAYLGIPDAVLMEIGSDLDCPREIIEELGTAVIEACTNAMEHGNGLDSAQAVELHIDVNRDRIVVAVLDHGRGFDYANWQPASDILRERGRGILIMREFTDQLDYDRTPDGRFRVRLIKRLARPE
ncbi:MAG: ATP-binding protein [Candidatus Krumholzibacteria bacterium]|nr:ATP-binding protein [Candidatus Krumholzibacteria bacterium]